MPVFTPASLRKNAAKLPPPTSAKCGLPRKRAEPANLTAPSAGERGIESASPTGGGRTQPFARSLSTSRSAGTRRGGFCHARPPSCPYDNFGTPSRPSGRRRDPRRLLRGQPGAGTRQPCSGCGSCVLRKQAPSLSEFGAARVTADCRGPRVATIGTALGPSSRRPVSLWVLTPHRTMPLSPTPAHFGRRGFIEAFARDFAVAKRTLASGADGPGLIAVHQEQLALGNGLTAYSPPPGPASFRRTGILYKCKKTRRPNRFVTAKAKSNKQGTC